MVTNVSDEGIRIGDAIYTGTLALTADRLIADWTSKRVAMLEHDDFAALLEDSPELVLLGTGNAIEFAPRELVFSFARRGVGLEVMDTAAAARTFNVLISEGRRVAAALYATR